MWVFQIDSVSTAVMGLLKISAWVARARLSHLIVSVSFWTHVLLPYPDDVPQTAWTLLSFVRRLHASCRDTGEALDDRRGGKEDSMKERSDHAVAKRPSAMFAATLIALGGLAVAASAQAQIAEAPPLVAAPSAESAEAVHDPLEGFNRGSFAVSMGVDRVVLRPITHGYMAVTPSPVRRRVSAVIYNLGEPSTTLNDMSNSTLFDSRHWPSASSVWRPRGWRIVERPALTRRP